MSSSAWASDHDGSLDKLRRVQGSLTVDLIMIPRSGFDTCTVHETAAQIQKRNVSQFSFLPVADENNRILGLYNAERWFSGEAPETKVLADFEPLSEDTSLLTQASSILSCRPPPIRPIWSFQEIAFRA